MIYQGDRVNAIPTEDSTNQRLSAMISGFTLRNIYASTVAIPAVYTEHKHQQYGTLKNIARKVRTRLEYLFGPFNAVCKQSLYRPALEGPAY